MAWAHGLVQISIHSAARAETLYHLCQQHRLWYFNPLRREGGDVSPVKPSACGRVHFNPLRREGGDRISIPGVHLLAQFQSTPPRGRRRPSRTGWPPYLLISIHSAARAETGPLELPAWLYPISIHSAARAETDFVQISTRTIRDFNPLRREGGDPSYK